MSFFLPDVYLSIMATVSHDFPSAGRVVLYLCGIVFFLLLNAFFVASEFAIVKVRLSQLESHGKETGADVIRAMHVVKHLDGYLSANQLGITIASLALGFLGEPFVEAMISPLLFLIGIPASAEMLGLKFSPVSVISFLLAIASFTFLHVVVGELLPKSIAIRKALTVTMVLSGPLHLFYISFFWVIRFFQGTANWLLKNIFKIDPISEGEHVHSAEELAILVTHSGKFKEVTDTEREILINALELNELWVRDVMTPRNEVVVLDADEPFEKAMDVAIRSKHTRFPLVKGHLDQAIGLIHIKDLFKLINDPDPDLMRIKRELKMVPDTMPLDSLLKFFLKEHAHLAMAVDEFGTPVGIVFLDNVMEELVGDIQDEFDNEHSAFIRVNDDEFVVEGSMTLNDLEGHVEELSLESGEVTTVGGYFTQQLERFPEVGETMDILGYEAKVTSTDGRRVGQIHFRKLENDEESSEEKAEPEEVA
ncbi:MAG: hemolysin family protein [Akkermansiaceae bacterium]|jgi:CBS domain containing-hemolysin-like protein|nr:hemolysin family protein [Akkermansiaceae bacterium]MDP4647129.1 hemolysin family protein [Akkermansiaceae bacterium]MDP4722599.1 hemolysin family protein [Akkermansiaceae bacterium]MDP4780423.1 hemolysin family protein [Akkermansiaceae bacterium]MDP4847740.1 hemolysin family protein [Akkermansiaceae bacterium]